MTPMIELMQGSMLPPFLVPSACAIRGVILEKERSPSSLLDSSSVQRSKLPLKPVTYVMLFPLLHPPIRLSSLVIVCIRVHFKAVEFGNKRGDTPRRRFHGRV